MSDLDLGLSFLFNQSAESAIVIFWCTLFLEVPRYGFPFVAIAIASLAKPAKPSVTGCLYQLVKSVTVIVVGHNEAASLETCVRSLCEQSFNNFEIMIVSDGSSDDMRRIAARLVRDGLAACVIATDLRSGKSSALNLAISACRSDIVINVDCDCSYDRFAIEEILKIFEDPSVGGACGDIRTRNGDASLVARFQEIEYLLSITVGKLIGNAFDQVTCLSGAFSAFRREALAVVGSFQVGSGEDLDVTLRLRAMGWRVVYVPTAICYTDAPVSVAALVRQRRRWERDSVRLRYRKHRDLMLPTSGRFHFAEAVHQWEFLLFGVVGALAFPVYIAWLFAIYDDMAITILVAIQLGLLIVDTAMLALAAAIIKEPVFIRNIAYMIGFSLFTSYAMRFVRLWAYFEEWLLFASIRDDYVPHKVRVIRKW
jgi:cellulose synthase/poly-beta-1,6-N-acetylglucosamine synthase-like glycosyltransferase